MRTIIFVLILSATVSVAFGEDPKFYTTDGRPGSVGITCLAGFQTGSGDLLMNNTTESGDLGGYVFKVQIESPVSDKLTLLLSIDYNKQSSSYVLGRDYYDQNWSVFTTYGGLRFFINP